MMATDSIVAPRLIGHGDFAYAPNRCGSSSHIRPIESDKVHY
jgi:hypothetical protein